MPKSKRHLSEQKFRPQNVRSRLMRISLELQSVMRQIEINGDIQFFASRNFVGNAAIYVNNAVEGLKKS